MEQEVWSGRLCGHTMAVPELKAPAAVYFFAEIGLTGIEVLCDEHSGLMLDASNALRKEFVQALRDTDVCPVALTPYVHDLNAPDRSLRMRRCGEFRRYIDLAAELGFSIIRCYGGTTREGWGRETLPYLLESLHELAEYAQARNIRIGIENHPGTLALSASETIEIIREVNSPTVGIIFDPANIVAERAGDELEALQMQRDWIIHVHVKDVKLTPEGRRAALIGEGDVRWEELIIGLERAGYEGYLALEYERKWHPDILPPASQGLPRCIERLF
ncbi:MAG TPA: sugar phosphate isomerase/epimerase [Caldilineae bacterium]|nr:sugar phosphate isomerase/epimerase [Caldilineae bacterium]